MTAWRSSPFGPPHSSESSSYLAAYVGASSSFASSEKPVTCVMPSGRRDAPALLTSCIVFCRITSAIILLRSMRSCSLAESGSSDEEEDAAGFDEEQRERRTAGVRAVRGARMARASIYGLDATAIGLLDGQIRYGLYASRKLKQGFSKPRTTFLLSLRAWIMEHKNP